MDQEYVDSGLAGESGAAAQRRSLLDWIIVIVATAVFVRFAMIAEVPHLALHWGAMGALIALSLGLLVAAGVGLWRGTRFN